MMMKPEGHRNEEEDGKQNACTNKEKRRNSIYQIIFFIFIFYSHPSM
jgi:hypothetical protein